MTGDGVVILVTLLITLGMLSTVAAIISGGNLLASLLGVGLTVAGILVAAARVRWGRR